LVAVAAAVLSWAAPVDAQAQTQWSLSAGAQTLHVPDAWSSGVNVDLGVRYPSGWGVVAEGGLTRDTKERETGTLTGTIYNVGAGPRWSYNAGRVTPFVQALAGLETSRGKETTPNGTFGDTDHAFMLQPGAGVFVSVGQLWGLFAQADGRYVFFKEEVDEQYRVAFGVRFALR